MRVSNLSIFFNTLSHSLVNCGLFDCSKAVTIVVQGKGTSTATLHGQNMTSEFLPLERVKGSPWIRVTVISQGGKRAWSNPIWLDQ